MGVAVQRDSAVGWIAARPSGNETKGRGTLVLPGTISRYSFPILSKLAIIETLSMAFGSSPCSKWRMAVLRMCYPGPNSKSECYDCVCGVASEIGPATPFYACQVTMAHPFVRARSQPNSILRFLLQCFRNNFVVTRMNTRKFEPRATTSQTHAIHHWHTCTECLHE